MRIRIDRGSIQRAGRRKVSPEERSKLSAQHASEHECYDTPSLRHFIEREDVVVIQAISGWYHVFVGKEEIHYHTVSEMLTAAVEEAQKQEKEGAVRDPGMALLGTIAAALPR